MKANQNCTFPPSCFHSPQLAALTFLSWPSGPRPWLRLLTTSPTELQIGWHTMPQILIQRHNAPTSHAPSILFNSGHIHSVHSLVHSPFNFLQLPPSPPQLGHPGNSVRRRAEDVSHLGARRGVSGTGQGSQSRRRREKQRWRAPSFKPGPLRQLPPPRSH